MKTSTQHPYDAMMTTAAVLARLPVEAPPQHVRVLAVELATAVRDLDARMRAGLTPPVAWSPPSSPEQTARCGPSMLPEQPAPGTVVVSATPTPTPRARSWRRLAARASGQPGGWLPQHEDGAAVISWSAVLDQCGGAVRVTHPATVASRVLTRHDNNDTT